MRLLYDFKCSDNHVTEGYVSSDITVHPCGVCANQAHRIISPVRSRLDPLSGDFPGATMKWATNRQKQIQHERKTSSKIDNYNPD
jgi:hypothetical protein